MKYIASLNGKKYEVELVRVSEYEMRSRAGEKATSQETDRYVDKEKAEVKEQKTIPVEEKLESGEHTGKYIIKSPMPGKVLKVNVNIGQILKQGDVALTIEAMKMETEIMAKEVGRVSSVNVNPGDAVNTGDVLIVIND